MTTTYGGLHVWIGKMDGVISIRIHYKSVLSIDESYTEER